MRTLIFALLLTAPAFAAEMTAEEAFELVELHAEHCQIGTKWDGGPALSDAEVREACDKYTAAMNRLAELGLE